MKFIKAIFGLLFFVLVFLVAVAFMSSNTQQMDVDLIVIPAFTASSGKVLLAVFVIGGLIGLFTASLVVLKQLRDKAKLERRLRNSSRLMSGLGAQD